MKSETDPITPEEWLIRLVWETKVKKQGNLVAAEAFEPLFRRECLNNPTDALIAIAEDKRTRYGIVQIPVSLVASLGLTVLPKPIAAVPGHVVVPELNITAYLAKKAAFTPIKVRLAEVASTNILLNPTGRNPG